MRCKNCGWENPSGQTTCEKCHCSLKDATPTIKSNTPVTDRINNNMDEGAIFYDYVSSATSESCQKCGYPISDYSTSCPNCGTPIAKCQSNQHHIERPLMHTAISPTCELASINESCTLKPIPRQNEDIDDTPIIYSGDKIILGRENTDADNDSISSIEQAVLSREDGEWYIENLSEQRTTYIRVNGKIKITNGDIIVLGNREFEFKG